MQCARAFKIAYAIRAVVHAVRWFRLYSICLYILYTIGAYVCHSSCSDLSLDKVVIFEVLIFKRLAPPPLPLLPPLLPLYATCRQRKARVFGVARAFMLKAIPDAISTERERKR